MIYAKYFTINESVPLMSHIIGSAQNHYIAVGSPGVDHVLGSANIVHGVVEPGDIVAIHLIVLEDDRINVIVLSGSWHSVNSFQQMRLELDNKILRGVLGRVCA